MHFTSFPEKSQLHFYLQTSIYHLQTPLKNYLTSSTPENSYLAATCLMMRFCVKATDQLPRSFILFDLLAERSFREGGGGTLRRWGPPPFIFIQLTSSALYLSWQLSWGNFFFLASFPRLRRFRTCLSPSLPPFGNGSDSINVRRRTYPPLFHASVNPGIFPCKEMKGSFEATGRQKRENVFSNSPGFFL